LLVVKNDDSKRERKKINQNCWDLVLGKWRANQLMGFIRNLDQETNGDTTKSPISSMQRHHSFETIVLQQMGETLMYKATVRENHNRLFLSRYTYRKPTCFVNPKHDYPQKLVIKAANNKSL
jgi:hypothetical protein